MMDQFTKEGRKLRPRKTSSATTHAEKVDFSSESGRSEYDQRPHRSETGEHRSFHGSPRPGYQGGRTHRNSEGGARRSYRSEEGRSYSEGGRSHNSPDRERGYRQGEGRPAGRNSAPRGGRTQGGKSFQKGGFKPSRPFKGKAAGPKFDKASSEGINRMIARRPVVNGSESSESYVSPVKDVIRLNKFIANSGVCSRREADTLIQAGVVTVNGVVVTELGTKVNVHDDDIRFNGERLKGEEKVYIIMNKPRGYVTTASDPHAEKTVIDLIKNCPARVYPVGRLDKSTTGVLLLTNDGEMAERLTHPSYDKKKIYQVALDKPLSEEDYRTVLSGVTLSDGEVKADELEYIDENDKRKLGIEIHSGKNRIVRRIFESLGYNVKALDRVYFAGLTKKGLKKGEWRYLSEGEVNILKIGAYV